MRKTILWILGIIAVAVILLLVTYFFVSRNNGTSAIGTTPLTTFPSSGSTATTSVSSSITTVPTQSGSSIATLDFLRNGITIEDPANPGTYYLAGSSGACEHNGTCPTAGTEKDFTILYSPSTGTFTIGLASEPLGSVRELAQQYLMNALGITEDQMCDLKYYIATTVYVNSEYGGENLGFSFCPGAVALPE